MSAPVLIAASYLVINFTIMVWLVREEVQGRTPPPGVVVISKMLRYGPPTLGLFYLVTLAGDWPFFLFVLAFFAIAFWLLDGLLGFPTRPRK